MKTGIKELNLGFAACVWVVFLAFVPYPCHAQDDKKKLNPEIYYFPDSVPEYPFEVLRNNPDTVSRFTISLYPLVPLGYNEILNTHIDYAEAEFNYDLNRHITLAASGAFSFDNNPDMPYYSPASFKPWQDYECKATFYFKTDTLSVIQHVANIRGADSLKGTMISLQFKGHISRKIGIRFGAGWLNTPVNSNNNKFIGYDVNDPNRNAISLNNDPRYYGNITPDTVRSKFYFYTNMLVYYASMGLVFDKIEDFGIKISNGRIKDVTRKYRFYADILYLPAIKYDNIIVTDFKTRQNIEMNVDRYTTRTHTGFRLGINFYNLKSFGGSRSFEIGYLPNAGLYGVIKIGMAINPLKKT